MIKDRRNRPGTPSPESDGDGRAATAHDTWAPTSLDEERHWRDHLREEMRPLVDSLARLRDRGLLD